MCKIIAVVNQKGGVGKTAVTCNLSYELAVLGKKTLIVDIEPSANSTLPYCEIFEHSIIDVLMNKTFDPHQAIYQAKVNEKPIDNLYIMPSDIALAVAQNHIINKPHKEKILIRQLERLQNEFDYIVIDCQPTLSELNLLAIFAANFIIIPVRYEKNALKGLNDLFNTINEVKEDQVYDFKILRNGLNATKKTIISTVQASIEPLIQRGKVFETILRQDEDINLATADDMPVSLYSSKSRGSSDYQQLTKELLNAT